MLAVWIFDLVAAAVLGATALVGAYLPVVLVRRGRAAGTRSLGFVLGNMLSAGVMVAAGFVGLLGEAGLELAHVSTYPLGAFLAAAGFMATLVADAAAESCGGTHGHTHGMTLPFLAATGGSDVPKERSSDNGDTPKAGSGPTGSAGADLEMGSIDLGKGPAVRGRRQGAAGTWEEASGGDAALVDQRQARSDDPSWQAPQSGTWEPASVLHEAMRDAAEGAAATKAGGLQEIRAALGSGSSNSSGAHVSALSAVLMTIALSFHSLLEGAALGAAQDVARSLQIFVAIQAHKGLTAFALGSSLVQAAAPPARFWTLVLTMAVATPIGIFIGFLLSGLTDNTGAACISALAAGTFIYVAIVEILPKELAEKEYKAMKVFMMVVGFGLMSLLAVWA